MYDYWLDGKDNYEADVKAADQASKLNPYAKDCARANRAFIKRVVEYLARQGISQFLDIGTGFPSQGNVHEVAQEFNPEARTLYVDNDPVVVTHGRALLATDPRTKMLPIDLRDPDFLFWCGACEADAFSVLDFTRPVGVLAVAVLHFIPPDDNPHGIVASLMEAMAPGSYLVLTHVLEAPRTIRAIKAYENASAPTVLRTEKEINRFFTDAHLSLIDPGVVRVPLWQPDYIDPFAVAEADHIDFLAGVATKS
ncbi:SAM-dependent methyltransferase [Nonomuraea sp. CA-143628]|uniref:SAM-dependent methyltransferase n=1 Tax=Nonomuraea sp. CA-143628 TaxID=3239997 RepID=UPI003D8F4F84